MLKYLKSLYQVFSRSIENLLDKVFLNVNNTVWRYTNIYPGSFIGEDNSIGSYVEIDEGVNIGDRNRIGAYTFIPSNVTIGDDCFIAPRVTFTNDKYPPSGKLNWGYITVEDGAAIGAGSVILTKVTIGKNALVGAGSVVTHDIPAGEVWYGNPAKFVRKKDGCSDKV